MPKRASKKAAAVSDDDIHASLYEIFELDEDTQGWFLPLVQKMADEAGVDLLYTFRAMALEFYFGGDRDHFIADPHNLKYRMPTEEEERVTDAVGTNRLEFYAEEMKQGRFPADYPYATEERAEVEKALRRVRLQLVPRPDTQKHSK